MTLPPSSSDLSKRSSAFERLNEKVQRWIWSQQWTGLRDIQEAAVEPILEGSRDVIIAAPTASGKTEAAFLPICSSLLERPGTGVRVLYVAPLKALINDQFERLEGLCEHLEIPVHRWHGDVAGSQKKRMVENPEGILLITPESLEGLFVRRATKLLQIFGGLSYVVVDELHSFVGTERGRQLQSHLNRLEKLLSRQIPRLALSATLGDMELAADFLRPGAGDVVCLIESTTGGQEIKIQLRGYRVKEFKGDDTVGIRAHIGDSHEIAEHVFKILRGSDNLVFANRRETVELFADLLRRVSEANQVPNEFLPHHGSLSKELREDVEARLKEKVTPETIVCTSTLEMGIDIGHVASVAQIGSPPSVAALRQRLGRSGRRGNPARLRIYVQEFEIADRTAPYDSLRDGLVQSIAMIRLLLSGWCEPPTPGALHLSTLVQQTLSLIAEKGGVNASVAWKILCDDGPFENVSTSDYARLLRSIAARDLIVQEGDGTLALGLAGERIVNHYTFYAVFWTPEEFRLVSGGRNLGSLSEATGLVEGEFLIFAGRRWLIVSVDFERRVVDVKPAEAGRTPIFETQSVGIPIHDRVRQEMHAIYGSDEIPIFLDERARDLLSEGRANFRRYRLDQQRIIPYGRDSLLFPWMGTRVVDAIWTWLRARRLRARPERAAVIVESIEPDQLTQVITSCVEEGPADPLELVQFMPAGPGCKYDHLIEAELLDKDRAARYLDTVGAWKTLSGLLADRSTSS